MNTVAEVMQELQRLGSAQTRKTFARHGAPESMFGVKVGDLKKVAKQIRGNQELALELYETGNSDAMYLAGIVADGARMNKTTLNRWAREASWYMISEYTVPGVAHQHPDARSIALRWMDAKRETVAAAGWCTYAGVLATRDDAELDLKEIRGLLKRIEREIRKAPNRVRYTMNGFVIAVGCYVQPLLAEARSTAQRIGEVQVDLGETACQVPLATAYIDKVDKAGRVGKKRKTIKC